MQMTEHEQNRLLHLLLEMGERLLSAGAEINRVEDTLERIGLAYGAARMNVFVITSSIIITMENADGRLLTHTRRINFNGGTDFAALEQLNELSRQCCAEPFTLDEFKKRMYPQKDPHRIRELYLGSILAAGSFAVFFGGTWMDGITAAIVGVLICFLQEKVTGLFANNIMFDLVCAFLTGIVICTVVKFLSFLNLDKIMIGDIMLLIPGIAMTNAVRDMLMGDTISGLMRLIESILWAGALAVGFMASIWMVRL